MEKRSIKGNRILGIFVSDKIPVKSVGAVAKPEIPTPSHIIYKQSVSITKREEKDKRGGGQMTCAHVYFNDIDFPWFIKFLVVKFYIMA